MPWKKKPDVRHDIYYRIVGVATVTIVTKSQKQRPYDDWRRVVLITIVSFVIVQHDSELEC